MKTIRVPDVRPKDLRPSVRLDAVLDVLRVEREVRFGPRHANHHVVSVAGNGNVIEIELRADGRESFQFSANLIFRSMLFGEQDAYFPLAGSRQPTLSCTQSFQFLDGADGVFAYAARSGE